MGLSIANIKSGYLLPRRRWKTTHQEGAYPDHLKIKVNSQGYGRLNVDVAVPRQTIIWLSIAKLRFTSKTGIEENKGGVWKKMRFAGFTESERELLEMFKELIEKGYVDDLYGKAAFKLKAAPSTIRSKISRMKSKYEDMMRFQKEFRHYQQFFYQKTQGRFNPLSRRGVSK